MAASSSSPDHLASILAQHNLSHPREFVWAHAVNSQQLLTDALEQAKTGHVHGIEADIRYCKSRKIPILSHNATSDTTTLPVETLLDAVLAHNQSTPGSLGSLVIKLDFKDPDAMAPSVELVCKRRAAVCESRTSVWLNGDLLMGPSGSRPWVSTSTFASACVTALPADDGDLLDLIVYSLSWMAGSDSPQHTFDDAVNTLDEYTDEMIDAMLGLVQQLKLRHCCFAVRACHVRKSWGNLTRLLDAVAGSSLLVWAHGYDIKLLDLNWLATQPHAARVFVDVPSKTYAAFQSS